jgi:hypothetical protein
MSVILQSSGGGQITINEPATASNFTQTLPAATGTVMVSGNQPAFSAYQSSAQSISANTFTIINLQTEVFDTNNNFASNRFTPTVAGYYQINATLSTTTPLASSIYFNIYIVKNGNQYTLTQGYPSPANYYGVTSSTVVYLNGSTDYIEMGTQSNSAYTVQADSRTTYLSGCLVRAA